MSSVVVLFFYLMPVRLPSHDQYVEARQQYQLLEKSIKGFN